MGMNLVKIMLSAVIFIASCALGAFSYWIGGGQLFTPDAGFMTLMTACVAVFLSTAPWVFIE